MTTRQRPTIFALAIACACLYPAEAKAAGIILVTHGETISHVGDVAPQHRQVVGSGQVGYKYSYFGIFWVDLWTWEGEFCVYEGDRYRAVDAATAAILLGNEGGTVRPPFLYSCPPGLMVLVPLILIGIVSSVRDRRKRKAVQRLFQDPRYQQAVKVVNEQYAKLSAVVPPQPEGEPAAPDPAADQERRRVAFEAGVQELVASGVSRSEAETNLGTVLLILMRVHAQQSAPAGTATPPNAGSP